MLTYVLTLHLLTHVERLLLIFLSEHPHDVQALSYIRSRVICPKLSPL